MSNVSSVSARRSTQSQNIDSTLAALMAMRGAVAAALVDGDGLVTHIRRNFDLDNDALGAAVQIALGSAAQASRHVAQGATEMVLMENKDGLILLAPLNNGFSIAIVADRSVMLGALRFEVKHALPALNQQL